MSDDPSETTEIIELNSAGICSTCPVCKHAINERLTEIYFEKSKDEKETIKWFDEKFKRVFDDDVFVKHFKEHIDPFVNELAFVKKRKIEDLKQKALASKKENSMRFNLIKQMTWEYMQDIFINRKELLKTDKEKSSHQRMTKQFNDLAKTYREYYQLELQVIGMGKTEEEQKAAMENFVAGMLKQAVNSLDDIPEAKERLSEFLDLHLSSDKKEESDDIIEEPDDDF